MRVLNTLQIMYVYLLWRAAFVFEMLLHEFFNVERKRRRDVNNRAVRRHLEKMVTDVVSGCQAVLLCR